MTENSTEQKAAGNGLSPDDRSSVLEKAATMRISAPQAIRPPASPSPSTEAETTFVDKSAWNTSDEDKDKIYRAGYDEGYDDGRKDGYARGRRYTKIEKAISVAFIALALIVLTHAGLEFMGYLPSS